MVIALSVMAGAFALLAAALAARLVLLRRAYREVVKGAEEKFSSASNAPVAYAGTDKTARRLAVRLSGAIDEVLKAGREYEAGNLELRRAVTNVSHDLRTPLTAAAGYVGMLKASGLTAEQQKQLSVIEGRLAAMKGLTEEMLAYFVAATEERGEAYAYVCVNDVLEDSLTQFYAAFRERGISPELRLCEVRVMRYTDRETLSRIFGNVISNAVRYSDGDFKVILRESGEIVFSNRASSLDEVTAARLFERFFTVENARGSTGLGMSIARVLTERLDGRISARWHDGILAVVMRI